MAIKKTTLAFVCDTCGSRETLDKSQRHWCKICRDSPVEMRCVRDRKPTTLAERDLASRFSHSDA